MLSTETGEAQPLARRIADAVLAVPGVVDLHGGVFGEVATYLPGGRVSGIALDDESGRVHLIVDIDHDLRAVANEAATTASEIAGFPVSVTIEDIALNAEARPGPSTPDATPTPKEIETS